MAIKEETFEQIAALHAKGMSNREIATERGCTQDAVRYILKKLRLTPHRPMGRRRVNVPLLFETWSDSSLTVAEVARKMGIATSQLYRLASHFALPDRQKPMRVQQEATPEDDEASANSLALAPAVQREIERFGFGMPKASRPDVSPWFAVTTEPGPYADDPEDGYPYDE